MSKTNTRNVSTTIREEDYQFLKQYNLHVSSALSVGVQTLKKIYQDAQNHLLDDDILLVKKIMNENKSVLKRLGEAN